MKTDTPPTYVVSPQGDVVLRICATTTQARSTDLNTRPDLQAPAAQPTASQASDTTNDVILIKVSKDNLIAVSDYFKVLFTGRFAEAQLSYCKEDPPIVELAEVDCDDACFLLSAIHDDPRNEDEYQSYKLTTNDWSPEQVKGIVRLAEQWDCLETLTQWDQRHKMISFSFFAIPAATPEMTFNLFREHMNDYVDISELLHDHTLLHQLTQFALSHGTAEDLEALVDPEWRFKSIFHTETRTHKIMQAIKDYRRTVMREICDHFMEVASLPLKMTVQTQAAVFVRRVECALQRWMGAPEAGSLTDEKKLPACTGEEYTACDRALIRYGYLLTGLRNAGFMPLSGAEHMRGSLQELRWAVRRFEARMTCTGDSQAAAFKINSKARGPCPGCVRELQQEQVQIKSLILSAIAPICVDCFEKGIPNSGLFHDRAVCPHR